ncbi:MAG TPA: protein kinase [Kofleriaceae bacterium]|nr:protein kinase [Kofleriaceae bacterium]
MGESKSSAGEDPPTTVGSAEDNDLDLALDRLMTPGSAPAAAPPVPEHTMAPQPKLRPPAPPMASPRGSQSLQRPPSEPGKPKPIVPTPANAPRPKSVTAPSGSTTPAPRVPTPPAMAKVPDKANVPRVPTPPAMAKVQAAPPRPPPLRAQTPPPGVAASATATARKIEPAPVTPPTEPSAASSSGNMPAASSGQWTAENLSPPTAMPSAKLRPPAAPAASLASAVPITHSAVPVEVAPTQSASNAIPEPIAHKIQSSPHGAEDLNVPASKRRTAPLPADPLASNGADRAPASGEFPAARPRTAKPSQATSLLPADQQFPRPEPRSGGSGSKPRREPRQPIEIGESTQIDRFGLIREIARGGMGQVFLARDTKLGRKVAIKFLLHDDPNFAQRFLIEARATARCTHENIVAIYEVGEYQGLPYMVLEYLEGKTLSQVLEAKPGPRQFAELMLSVFRALERAHEHGIVHRDLKPSNIFVTDRGQVKVLDFGVARIFDPAGDDAERIAANSSKDKRWESTTPEGERHTYVTFSGGGTMVGTLPYMSPEQWGADTVDLQSDIWACGIMFWRALTGVHPAGTMNADKLRVRLTDLDTPLPSLGARDPSLPAELVAIVDRCLQKHKSERYQTATQAIQDLQAFLAPKAERISPDVCPYRGLASFGENDAKYFFGRSNEIRTAVAQLEAWPLLAVIGPSGVGKSSFVHAGLLPAMRATGGTWHVRVLRPGRQPLQSLASALDETIDTGVAPADVIDQLGDSPGLFGEYLRKAAIRKKHKVMLVVDQLEELFTLSDNDEVRKTFLAALLAAADDATAPVRVVLSMRADFLDRLAGHKQFLSELSRGLFFLSAPDLDNLRETLVRPAELAGYTFEDSWIVEDMMQAATSKGALPLLQFAATRLWDARDRTKRKLTIAAYNAMGGVGGAFARHADEVAAAVPSQSQKLLRAMMTRLVTAEGTRAVIDHTELLELSSDRQEVERILDQLVRARLVLMHTEGSEGTTVEIVHEVLISEWPTLARWLEDSQAMRGFMQELRQATKQWQSKGKRSDLVWRGAQAQDALATTKRHLLDLSSQERDFLDAVRKQLASSRRKRVLGLSFVFVVLGVILAGGAFFTIQLAKANSEANDALVEAKKAKAQVQAQLDEVKAAQERKDKAEAEAKQAAEIAAAKAAEAQKANQQVAQSQEDLAAANLALRKKVEEAEKANATAQELARVAQENAKKAATAKEVAEKATAEAKAEKARTQQLLAAEKERVKQLEAEKSKISTGGL